MKYEKEPFTFEEQADHLIEEGLEADRGALIARLAATNYFRFCAYVHPFRQPDMRCAPGTRMEQVWRLYTFDHRLRMLCLDAIESIEVQVRTQLAYHFAHTYGPFEYLNAAHFPNFDAAMGDFGNWKHRIEKQVERSLDPKGKEDFVVSYFRDYGDQHDKLPVWMMVELLDFGGTLSFFRGVKADIRKTIADPLGQAVLQGADFKALWDRIKHKTTYRVQFDNEALLLTCIAALKDPNFVITRTRLQWRMADLAIGRAGVEATETATSAPVTLDEGDIELPDILTDLQDKTSLTRRSIYRILVGSGRLDDFKRNPQQFIELAAEIINRSKRMALVDGIKYQRIGAEEYYSQQLFETEELSGHLKSMIDANKSVHEQVIYQMDTERTFAEQLERNEAIKVYAKLPGWFKVPTPLGTYTPDWAVLVDKDGTERLYFVVETKSSLFTDDLRDKESAKINCGKAHFAELARHSSPSARFEVETSLEGLLAKC